MVQYSRFCEGADLALALDDQPQRDRLHASRGKPAPHLVPQQRRDLVAHQPVQHAPRLLRIHQVRCSPGPGFSNAFSMAFLVISLNITR